MPRVNLEEKNFIEPVFVRPKFEARPAAPKIKKGRFKRNCGVLIFVLFVSFLITATAVAAKTGIFQIPVFSSIFYRLPQPSRQIEIKDHAFIAGKNLNYSVNPETKKITLELTEEDLTFLLRQALTKNNPYFAPNLQAAVLNNEVEFYGLLLKPFAANLTLKLKPSFSAGQLDFTITKVKIGDLSLPAGTATALVHRFFSRQLEQFNSVLAKFKPESLQLSEGVAKVILGEEAATLFQNNFNNFNF